MDTWAVDLANVGAIYPWRGWEVVMVVAATAAWILWHILQIRQEQAQFAEDIREYGKPEQIKKALDDHPV